MISRGQKMLEMVKSQLLNDTKESDGCCSGNIDKRVGDCGSMLSTSEMGECSKCPINQINRVDTMECHSDKDFAVSNQPLTYFVLQNAVTVNENLKDENINNHMDLSSESLVDDSDFDEDYVPQHDHSMHERSDMDIDVDVNGGPSDYQADDTIRCHLSEQNTSSYISNGLGRSKKNSNSIFSRKVRAERKYKRNTGQCYTTTKGKIVKAKMSKPLKDCRMKCKEVLEVRSGDKLVREKIFDEFWALGNRDKRVGYVASLVESKEPAVSRKRTNDPEKEKYRKVTNTFYFKVDGKRINVCRGCFMRTLDVTKMFVTLAIMNQNTSVSGIISDDSRGHHSPKNKFSVEKLNEVKEHVLSFPLYESHYTRRKSTRLYLPHHLDLTTMYQLYSEKHDNPVSRQIYEREFHKLNISFKKPKVDTCHKCDILNCQLKIAKDEEEKIKIQKAVALHHEEADIAFLSKKSDKKLAEDNVSVKCYSFDLQQCLPTPFLSTSVSFYKRQLWTYNLTMHETSNSDVICYVWNETEGGRGGNQIATCISKELIALPPYVTHVTLYSDTCGGQNRNSHVASMFLYVLQENKNLETIDHKFMLSGHGRLDCDKDHGTIEKQKKKTGIPNLSST